MTKILIKGIKLEGRMCNPGDKYADPKPGPIDWDAESSYKKTDEYLKKNAQVFIPEVTGKHYIGFTITKPAAACYIFNTCLVAHGLDMFKPFSETIEHLVYAVNDKDNIQRIEDTLEIIKQNASWLWSNYWKDIEPQTIEAFDKFENTVNLFPELPMLLQE